MSTDYYDFSDGSDWLSGLGDSISTITPDNSGLFTNTGTNFESGLAGLSAQSPGLAAFNVNANYPGSGSSGILSGLSGLLAGGGSGGTTTNSLLNSLLGIGSGIYGLSQANNLQGLSTAAIAAANPFGPYRAQYAGQLNSLMANPSSITSSPGYQAAFNSGDQAVARQMAASGYAGSGNEAIALQSYGQNFENTYLTQQENMLAGLAGANITPNAGPGLSGYNAGINASSNALGSLGYGATMASQALGGTGTTANPMGNFSSAGGEAATVGAAGQLATGLSGLYDYEEGSNAFSGVGNAAGIASGIASGTPVGYGSAALNAGVLAGKEGYLPSGTSNALGDASDVLGIYTGLEKGGVVGDTSAGVNAVRLGAATGELPAEAGTLAGYAAIPLSLYEFGENWQSGATGSDALSGAESGASIGTAIVPGIGTAVGAVIGGAVGALSSAFGGGKKDPETTDWNQFTAANQAAGGGLTSQLDPSGAYQMLAGMMDAKNNTAGHSTNLEMAFGRMGEGTMMAQMTQEINNAVNSGQIQATATPAQIYSQIVEPWLKSKNAYIPSNAIISSNGTQNNGTVDGLFTQLIGQWQTGELNSSSPLGVSGQTIQGLQNFVGLTPQQLSAAQTPKPTTTYSLTSPVARGLAGSMAYG